LPSPHRELLLARLQRDARVAQQQVADTCEIADALGLAVLK